MHERSLQLVLEAADVGEVEVVAFLAADGVFPSAGVRRGDTNGETGDLL
jgi:hypothetical protein